jgi:hypothetical protein
MVETFGRVGFSRANDIIHIGHITRVIYDISGGWMEVTKPLNQIWAVHPNGYAQRGLIREQGWR